MCEVLICKQVSLLASVSSMYNLPCCQHSHPGRAWPHCNLSSGPFCSPQDNLTQDCFVMCQRESKRGREVPCPHPPFFVPSTQHRAIGVVFAHSLQLCGWIRYLSWPASKDVCLIGLSLILTEWVCMCDYIMALLKCSEWNVLYAFVSVGREWCLLFQHCLSMWFIYVLCVFFPRSLNVGAFGGLLLFVLFVEGKVWCSLCCLSPELGRVTKDTL